MPNLFSLNNGVNKPDGHFELIRRRVNSLHGSLQLNWDGYLFLDVTARNDWSSTMSKSQPLLFLSICQFIACDLQICCRRLAEACRIGSLSLRYVPPSLSG